MPKIFEMEDQMLFVAHHTDRAAREALLILRDMGYATADVEEMETIPPSAIGLFGSSAKFRNKHLRLSSHCMEEEGFKAPAWGSGLVFLVAVNEVELGGKYRKANFRNALKVMADYYASWHPFMKKPDAPWIHCWSRGTPHQAFRDWHARARKAAGDVTVCERLSYYLNPVFTVKGDHEIDRLLVTGCALFNKPHTDVVSTIPTEKRDAVVRVLASILRDSSVSEADFIVPGPDLLDSRLRLHFHPFMFESIAAVEGHLGFALDTQARLFGHMHARSDEEIAQALEASAECIRSDVVGPISAASGVTVQACSWTERTGPYLERAHDIARKHSDVAARIYVERVETRPSYASLHAIDPVRGLERTIANNVLYIAEALYLKDHPTTGIVNCEFADTFWKGLEDILAAEVWGDWRPYIGMAASEARQPWSY